MTVVSTLFAVVLVPFTLGAFSAGIEGDGKIPPGNVSQVLLIPVPYLLFIVLTSSAVPDPISHPRRLMPAGLGRSGRSRHARTARLLQGGFHGLLCYRAHAFESDTVGVQAVVAEFGRQAVFGIAQHRVVVGIDRA